MQHDPDDIRRAMTRLKRALEKRMRLDDRAEELARREAKPIRQELADFDMRGFARRLRPMLEYDGRGYRAIAEEIGVTSPDLSRVMSGQQLAYPKVRAICAWSGLDPDRFYLPPPHAPKPRKRPRRSSVSRASAGPSDRLPCDGAPEKSGGARSGASLRGDVFHVSGTETVERAG